MALPTPAHHQAAWGIDFLVLAHRDVLAIHVDPGAAGRPRVELGADPHPPGKPMAIRQVRKDDIRWRLDPLRDLYRARQVLNHVAFSGNGLPLRRARAAGPGRASTSAEGQLPAGPAPGGPPGSIGGSPRAAP